MNLDRLKYRYWQHTDWHDINSPLEAVYCNAVDGCDPTIAVSDFEFCTGLKDRNGNLIYEGDIIHEVDKEADIDDVSQIVWNQETCHFMKLDLPETGLDRHCILCEDDRHYIEIIGNIHEQAEQKDK